MGEWDNVGAVCVIAPRLMYDCRIGTVVAPVIGSYAIFNHVGDDQKALQNVQWIYLAIACFVFLLAVVFYL